MVRVYNWKRCRSFSIELLRLPCAVAAAAVDMWATRGSDRGGKRAAAMYSLIITAKLNSVDPRAWLVDVLRRIADHPASRLHELRPWNWRKITQDTAAAA